MYIFNLSLKNGVFPDRLKLARVIPVFKSGDDSNLSNYRPISILPCFSKILERIMYNRLSSYLQNHNILYNNQYGFKKGHSTQHAVIKLVDEILIGFDKNKHTLGVFIDLAKAFDTVDHEILLYKLNNYGIKNKNLKWFRCYLNNRKQALFYNKTYTSLETITHGVPQGSILGPLLFLIYINDIFLSSSILNFILFADDTQAFYTHSNINTIFNTVNQELEELSDWFKANKLSVNIDKSSYILFTKSSNSDRLPLKLPDVFVDETRLNRAYSIKFLGVLLDEHISWKDHINILKNKISKNIGIMHKTRYILNNACLKKFYFAYVHSYINYCNIAWASTYKSKLDLVYKKQKQACRILTNANRYASSKQLMRAQRVLNIYEQNIYCTLQFMFKLKHDLVPEVFHNYFRLIDHKYQTKYSTQNYYIPKISKRQSKFSISYRGPQLWNSFLTNNIKTIKSFQHFKCVVKQQLLDLNINETTSYF